jgi:hypothetical protein
MWFTSEPSLRMSSFKTKIRRRKYALSRGGGRAGGPPARGVTSGDDGSSSRDAAPEWEFVNFNPVIYGRGGRPLAQPPLPNDTGLVMTAPPLPPREISPVMPPPRPPSFCIPAATESLPDATGTVRAPSLDSINLYLIFQYTLQFTRAHLKCFTSLWFSHQSPGNGFKR